MKTTRLILALLGLTLFILQPIRAAAAGPVALVLTIDGVIAPAAQEYLSRGIKTAEQRGAEVIILQLNTPGGSLDSTMKMIRDMRASTVPVVVYVTPRGAWAASAGAIITMAGHASAMTPETSIGAASPVGGEGEDLNETMEAKVKNQMKAAVAELVAHRSPEAQELAAAMIDEARAVSSTQALQIGLIDFIARDLADLLRQLDGVTVELADGERTLDLAGAVPQTLGMSLIEEILDILTNPNIVFLLLSIGVQAILIEISSPGGWVAGFIGLVCLALATFGLGVLPVNWFGLIFIVTAFALFILDIKTPTHGGLTAAGIGSFIVGALVLFNSPGTPAFQQVSLPLVILVAVIIGLSFAIIIGFALLAQRARVRTGQEGLVGAVGVARTDLRPGGQVQAAGELWSAEVAEGSGRVRKGDRIEVVKVDGLRLKVRKKD